MKRLVLILAFAAIAITNACQAAAQYNDVYRRGARLYSSDGTRLTPEQISAIFQSTDGLSYRDWVKNSRGFRAGKGLLIASGSLTGAGLVTLGVGAVGLAVEGIAFGIGAGMVAPIAAATGETPEITYDSKFRGVAIAGLVMSATGMAGLITGATVYCVYRKRLNGMVDTYNETAAASLSFGMQRNGVGLSLNF